MLLRNKFRIVRNPILTKTDTTFFERIKGKNYGELIKLYMSYPEKVTVSHLSERTGISESTLYDMRSCDGTNNDFSVQYMIAFCVGLHVDPMFSFYLLEKSGTLLRAENERDAAFIIILNRLYPFSVLDSNDFLATRDLPKLTQGEITRPHRLRNLKYLTDSLTNKFC